MDQEEKEKIKISIYYYASFIMFMHYLMNLSIPLSKARIPRDRRLGRGDGVVTPGLSYASPSSRLRSTAVRLLMNSLVTW